MKPCSRRRLDFTGAILVLWCMLVGLAACESPPTSVDKQPAEMSDLEPSFAAGGIRGPPSDVILPDHIGPPPHARVRIPPHAGPPVFLSSMVGVGAGFFFSCALRSDGAAFCWGQNNAGQLGDGTTLSSAVPVRVLTEAAFERLFVGDHIACGLDSVGRAYCWGANLAGELGAGIPVGTPSLVPIPIPDQFRFTDMDLGLRTSCGIGTDGVAYCWGSNNFGELGVGLPAGQGSTVPLPVTNSFAVGLRTVNNGFTNTCGLSSANQVFCWGRDLGAFGNGTANNPGSPTPVLAASAMQLAVLDVGGLYACGLDAQGQAHCWGRNLMGEMGNGTLTNPTTAPSTVSGGHTFASIYTDDTNFSFKEACGLTSAGDAWCWGANDFGQLGAPSTETCFNNVACSTRPVAVGGGIPFRQMALGGQHTCGLATDGAVYCWGRNQVGQLGDGTLENQSTPVPVRF